MNKHDEALCSSSINKPTNQQEANNMSDSEDDFQDTHLEDMHLGSLVAQTKTPTVMAPATVGSPTSSAPECLSGTRSSGVLLDATVSDLPEPGSARQRSILGTLPTDTVAAAESGSWTDRTDQQGSACHTPPPHEVLQQKPTVIPASALPLTSGHTGSVPSPLVKLSSAVVDSEVEDLPVPSSARQSSPRDMLVTTERTNMTPKVELTASSKPPSGTQDKLEEVYHGTAPAPAVCDGAGAVQPVIVEALPDVDWISRPLTSSGMWPSADAKQDDGPAASALPTPSTASSTRTTDMERKGAEVTVWAKQFLQEQADAVRTFPVPAICDGTPAVDPLAM